MKLNEDAANYTALSFNIFRDLLISQKGTNSALCKALADFNNALNITQPNFDKMLELQKQGEMDKDDVRKLTIQFWTKLRADYTALVKAISPDLGCQKNESSASCGEQDYDCQIAAASKAIQANSNDAAAYVKRGNAYDEKGNSNQAILDYNKAIELNPKNSSAYYNRAVT
jgi:tetratricopeptide (TPR) repeat protein